MNNSENQNKSLLEEALVDLNRLIEEAKENAKEVLAAAMPEKIDQLVKESLTQKLEDENKSETTTTTTESVDNVVEVNEEELDQFVEKPKENEVGKEETTESIDMREKSDEEVIETYENMGDDTSIKIDQSENTNPVNDIELNLDDLNLEALNIQPEDSENSDELDAALHEALIALKEEIEKSEEEPKEKEEDKKPEETKTIDEVKEPSIEEGVGHANTLTAAKKVTPETAATERNETKTQNTRPALKNESVYIEEINRLKNKANALIKENKELKTVNTELQSTNQKLTESTKSVINEFQENFKKLEIHTTKLGLVTRLFVENVTTEAEKKDIITRFDSIKTKEESKKLFETINLELKNKSTISESVNEKLNKVVKTSHSETLTETTAYEDESLKTIKRLMYNKK